ncbi:MAG: hypothetical protein OXN17_12665 [Candidatus Poribacteria bacterium]|nr:hypothetical protein [Candidatus Poribacteria bacterium]MDE0506195.1 hypothetical protein [Candidatus Poribacteria bacterium]
MRFITDIHERISDTLNPIMVRELRQAVHGHFLSVTLLLFLSLQLLVVGLIVANESLVAGSFNAGRDSFSSLLFVLTATFLLFVPAYAGIRLAIERSDQNVDLLFITSLRSWSIIWGKCIAALVFTVLLYSAGMPFIAFTYLLRGIDLPSIFSLMAINFVVAAAGIQCAILIGALPVKWAFKLILGMLWLGCLIVVVPSAFGQAVMPGGLLDLGIANYIGSWRFWGISLCALVVALTIIGAIALLAAAAISPLSANRALPVRSFLTVTWLLTGIGAAVWSYLSNSTAPVGWWAFLHVVLHSIGLFIAVSERESVGMRIRRSIPRRWTLRQLAFLFYSGAGGGVAWSCLMMILTFAVIVTWSTFFPFMGFPKNIHEILWRLSIEIAYFLSATLGTHLIQQGLQIFDFNQLLFSVLPIFAFYTFSYALGAAFIRRCFFANRVSTRYTWVVGLALSGISTTVVPVIAFFYSGTWSASFFAASPIGAFLYLDYDHSFEDTSITIAISSALLVAVLNIPWFVRQYTNFQPVWQRRANSVLID